MSLKEHESFVVETATEPEQDRSPGKRDLAAFTCRTRADLRPQGEIFTDYFPAFTGFYPLPANRLYADREFRDTFDSTNRNKTQKI